MVAQSQIFAVRWKDKWMDLMQWTGRIALTKDDRWTKRILTCEPWHFLEQKNCRRKIPLAIFWWVFSLLWSRRCISCRSISIRKYLIFFAAKRVKRPLQLYLMDLFFLCLFIFKVHTPTQVENFPMQNWENRKKVAKIIV